MRRGDLEPSSFYCGVYHLPASRRSLVFPIPYSPFPIPSFFTFLALLGVYVASLAPSLTLWDAGEFQAAVASLGIPHPPGAPLYILIARAWYAALPGASLPYAVNLLSAVATAAAGGMVTRLFHRWTGSAVAGIAAGLFGGLMMSVWSNATETEVYALSTACGLLLLLLAEKVADNPRRRAVLIAWCMGLATALHLDALVAVPAVVVLAAWSRETPWPRWRRLLPLAGAGILAIGIGRGSPLLVVAGVLVLLAAASLASGEGRTRTDAALLGLAVIGGASAVLFMLVRAAHDPVINQGNPSTWRALWDVVTRDQYQVPGIFPRRAPLWLQLANVGQYADWQVALGFDGETTFSWRRIPFSLSWAVLACIGARWHWRHDRRSAASWLLYLAAGLVGVALILNLEAGPTIGYGLLPTDAGHEARERDYFFAAGFLACAAWAGVGVWVLTRSAKSVAARWSPVALALVPLVGNWGAVNRRREPDASLPLRLADALLLSAPPRAVLLLAADNDSYAVWQAQAVRHLRPDVTPVTLSLLGAEWYREELRRRHRLVSDSLVREWPGEEPILRDLRRSAQRTGRPFAVATSVPRPSRLAIARAWNVVGLALVPAADTSAPGDFVDTAATRRVADYLAIPDAPRDARDTAGRYVQELLKCPARALETPDKRRNDASLDSICNSR